MSNQDQEEKIYLVLGCFGRNEDNFVFCSSSENRILTIDENLVYFEEIWEYFENLKLIDKPMLDTNAIRHLVFNLQDRYDQKVKRLWTEYKFRCIERFIHMHKDCGLYCKLSIECAESIVEEKEEEVVQIKGVEIPEQQSIIIPVSKVARIRR